MARETKAERLAREAAEKLAQQAALAATYPQRLMALLERAQNVRFELKVKDGESHSITLWLTGSLLFAILHT